MVCTIRALREHNPRNRFINDVLSHHWVYISTMGLWCAQGRRVDWLQLTAPIWIRRF